MTDPDEELLALFKVESDERLQNLDHGLLRLEANPADLVILEEVFREAHNLKGAARMMGAAEVERVAHHFEDVLGSAKRGQVLLSQETIDRLCGGLTGLRALVQEVITGKPSGHSTPAIIAQLNGAMAAPLPEASDQPDVVSKSKEVLIPQSQNEPGITAPLLSPPDLGAGGLLSPPASLPQNWGPGGCFLPQSWGPGGEAGGSGSEVHFIEDSDPAPEMALVPSGNFDPPVALAAGPPSVPDSTFKIETIRVETQKLDGLMTQAGELSVTTMRIARRLGGMDEIIALGEQVSKDAIKRRALINEMSRDFRGETLERLAARNEREIERLDRLSALLDRIKAACSEDQTRLGFVADELSEGIRKMRLLPLSTIFNLFPRTVRDLARDEGKEVQLLIEGADTAVDKRIIEEMKDPLMHLIRNAVDHGIETPDAREAAGKPRAAVITLRAYQTNTNVIIESSDDGQGIDLEGVKKTALRRGICGPEELQAMSDGEIRSLIFAPGFSTRSVITDVSGRGVGLDVVRQNIDRLKGTIEIESSPGFGCTFRLQLPTTLSTTRVLIATVDNQAYAVPVEFVERALLIEKEEIFTIQGSSSICLDGQPVSAAHLSDLLELKNEDREVNGRAGSGFSTGLLCIILSVGGERLGIIVDGLLDEQEVVLKPLGAMLSRVRNISGAAILGTGDVCMVINPGDLIKSVRKRLRRSSVKDATSEVERKKVVLLVEDSITTRTQEKRILEGAGYEVVTAVDGLDGFNKLSVGTFDAVISDIEMPNMDGLALSSEIRKDSRYKELPIILVTSLASDESRKSGIEAGANAYITKSSFNQTALLETLQRLI